MRILNWVVAAVMAVGGAARGGSDRCVVIVSVDGLAGFYLDDPQAEMPVIRELAREGARAGSMRASTPTVTWPNHTTIVTGVNPAKHGVVGNNYYDRATGKMVVLIGDPVLSKDEIVKVATIYDVAQKAGLTTAGVQWPATRRAKTLDWMSGGGVKAEEEKEVYTMPGAMEAVKSSDKGLAGDEGRVGAFDLILKEHRPNLALLHISNMDHVQHRYGPRTAEAYAAARESDRQIGEVWDVLKREFPGTGTLIVVSDHGFSPIEHALLPNVTLREAGLIDVKGMRVVGGEVVIVPQGGSAFIYVKDEAKREEIMGRVRRAFAGAEGIERIIGPGEMGGYGVAEVKDDPHAPDLILFAKEGWVFGDTAAGALAFVDKPEKSGTHGHNADLPDLHAMFVAWGEGIKEGASVGEISNVDVTPTVARLLGLKMEGLDGKVLEGVLEKKRE